MKKTVAFLVFTFVISYSLAIIYGIIFKGSGSSAGFTILGVIYMFIPFISAIIVKLINREPLFKDLSISFRINRWFFVAWLIFPVMTAAIIGVSVLMPWLSFSPEMAGLTERYAETLTPEALEQLKNQLNSLPENFVLLSIIQGLIAGITINAVAAFGEEAGWRGFLLNEFKDMRFFKTSLIIGFIWGIWHAPLILMGHNYPQHPEFGVVMMIIWCILLSPIFIYIRIKSKSVIAAAIAHGTLNAVAGLSIMVISGGNDLTSGVTGIPGFITLLIFNAGFFVFDRFITKEKIMSGKISIHANN